MDKNELLGIVKNDRILQRGIEYFRQGRVRGYEHFGNWIVASVSGSRPRPYKVRIELDKTGKPKYRTCDCPYSGGHYVCKHIVAVLERFVREEWPSVPPKNPLIKDKEKFDEDVTIALAETRGSPYKNFDHLENLSGIAVKGRNKSNKNFLLVFVIEKNYYNSGPYYRSANRSGGWSIYPALRYKKQNGELGMFAKFKEENLTEPCGEEEAVFLQKLIDRPGQEAGFIDYADELARHNFKNVYLRTDGNNYVPVFFEEMEKASVKFRLKKAGESSVFFKPVLDIYGKKGGALTEFELSYRQEAVRIGFDVYVISHEGGIFFRHNSKSFYSLFRIVSELDDGFAYHDIRKTKKHFRDAPEIDILFDARSLRFVKPVPKPIIELDTTYPDVIDMELLFDYFGKTAPYKSEYEFYVLSEGGAEIKVARTNRRYENEIYLFLCRKFDFIKKDAEQSKLIVNMPLVKFLSEHGREIINEGIEIRLKGGKQKISASGSKLSINVSSGIDWFDLDVGYISGTGSWEKAEMDLSLFEKGLIKTGDSYTIISKKDIDKLMLLEAEKKLKDGKIRVSKYNFGIINELYKNIENRKDKELKNIRDISLRLKDFSRIEEVSPPENFTGVLRHYQQAGYNWLWFLNRFRLNGCLADDMGLGKTVQALALLQKLKEKKGRKFKTSLIVVPVSAISNWEIEIKKFTPALKYVVHIGQTRKKCIKHLTRYDIVIVSYHTLRNDIEVFNERDYGYIILDESQNIKNYKSLTFRAIKTLKSDFRLSLTGTPIENNTLELWSLMEFLNSGLLGTSGEFKRKFVRAIEQLKDKDAALKLRKKVFPFMLRRKKEDVLKELPAKSEIVLYSDMEKKQRELYENYRRYYRAKVMGKIKKSGIENSAFEIFTALLRLRQTALFPSLADKKHKNIPSCKFEQVKGLMSESLQEGHKVLLFSQFVESLKILRHHADKMGYKYSYLDGSVPAAKRKEQIKKFQERDDIPLFFLSLRAGGTAINLTAADYVILFDPWWNPAVEAQAVDRAHRIGQTRKVIAYKMIVKNSVEEKILELQEKKKELVKNIISAESGFYKSLTKDDIDKLFT